MSVRAVLFDFDFTLGDSADAIVHCSRAAFADMGLTPAEPRAFRRTIGLTLQDSFRVLTGDEAPGPADEYTRCYVAHADRVMTAMTTVYEPAAAVLATMRRAASAPQSCPRSTATGSNRSSRTWGWLARWT